MIFNKKTVMTPFSVRAFEQAGEIVRNGGLVAFPTETVYGLGANALDDSAVASIFEAKGRPQFNPLIVHIYDIAQIDAFAEMTPLGAKLAERFWPAPLTLVLPRKKNSPVSYLVSAGLDSIAVRFPAHPAARAFLKACDVPVAAPSANISGTVSPTTAQHVADGLNGRIDMILQAEPCRVGVESTVVAVDGDKPVLLRAGGVTVEELSAVAGDVLRPEKDETLPRSPGQMLSHYAPALPVRLNASEARGGEALLGFGHAPDAVLNLSEKGDLREAAANLFAYLRKLDNNKKYTGIAVMPVPMNDLGLAINDRLKRAAYPKRAFPTAAI